MSIEWDITKGVWDMAKQLPSLATVVVMMVLAGSVAYGYIDFAKASELEQVKKDVADLKSTVDTVKTDGQKARRENLEGQMFAAKVAQCTADNPDLKKLYAQRVANLQVKYAEAGGGKYELPDCEDL